MQFKLLYSFYLNGKQASLVQFLVGFNNFFLTFALNVKKRKEKSLEIRSTNRTIP